MAMSEVSKTGAVTKNRYQKLQQTYTDFTNAMIDEVFRPSTGFTSKKEEVVEEEPSK